MIKRARELFTLTVSEQRVVIVLFATLVLGFAVYTYRGAAKDNAPFTNQPSPSPGIRP
jgi:hypothetical protein